MADRDRGEGESWECGPGGDLLFRTLGCSTIGAEGFHGRVRDGIGCLAPRYGHQAGKPCPRAACPWQGTGGGDLFCHVRWRKCLGGRLRPAPGMNRGLAAMRGGLGSSANRAISTGQLRGLPRFHLRPIDVVVFHGSRRDLVLRRVSRLDAFSGYPVRT
jgi:hypothetical protein